MQALGIAWDSRPKAAGRPALVPPLSRARTSRPAIRCTGPASARTGTSSAPSATRPTCARTSTRRPTRSRRRGPSSTCRARPATAPARTTSRGRRSRATGKALDATKGLAARARRAQGRDLDAGGRDRQRAAQRAAADRRARSTRARAAMRRASRLSDDYVHGKPPLDTHRLALLDDDLYWNDGQMRDEVYNWGSFVQSRMYAQGVTCSDCHDPHSLKLRAPGNAVCAQCHQPAKFDAPAHTHHAEGTPGAACAACHMPTTTYMVVDPRHDHSMRIPRPDLSAKLGMPNACNNCHAKQTRAVGGRRDRGNGPASRPRASRISPRRCTRARSGAPGARGALLALIDDKAQPAIVRASAIERLGHWLTPATLDARVARAQRSGSDRAARGGRGARERRARDCGSATCRACWTIRCAPCASRPRARSPARRKARSSPDDRARFDKALAEYIAVQTYNADRPEARMSLGNLYAARGDPAAAIAEYRKAHRDRSDVRAGLRESRRPLSRARRRRRGRRRRCGRDSRAIRAPRCCTTRSACRSCGRSACRKRCPNCATRRSSRPTTRASPTCTRSRSSIRASRRTRRPWSTLRSSAIPYDRSLNVLLVRFDAANGNIDGARARIQRLRELDPESPDYDQLEARSRGRARS